MSENWLCLPLPSFLLTKPGIVELYVGKLDLSSLLSFIPGKLAQAATAKFYVRNLGSLLLPSWFEVERLQWFTFLLMLLVCRRKNL
jgi:hypothetical protein